MRLYMKSSLNEQLLTLLESMGATSEFAVKTQKGMDAVNNDAMKWVDDVVNTLNSAVEDSELKKFKNLAKKAVRGTLNRVVDETLDFLKSEVRPGFSVEDLIAVLTDAEDIVAAKGVVLKADPVKSKSNYPFDEEGRRIYGDTIQAMSDAVYNYGNAPRAEASTFLTVYTTLPTGLLSYIGREFLNITKIFMSPVFKGVGLDSISEEGGFLDVLKDIGSYYRKEAYESKWMEKPVSLGTPVLKRSNAFGFDFGGKTSNDNPENEYTWYIECPVEANPLVPVTGDTEVNMRISILGDAQSELTFIRNDKDYVFKNGVYPPATDNPDDRVLFSTMVGDTALKKANVKMPLDELFEIDQPSDLFDILEENPDLEVFVEYWEVDPDSGALVSLIDFRYVDMSTNVPSDPDMVWYGVSVGGLGSMIPGVDDAVDIAKEYLKEFIDTILETEKLTQEAINETYKAIIKIVRRIALLTRLIITLFVKILRIVFAMDLRFAVFYGSYKDLTTIWRIMRADFQLNEQVGNNVYAAVINVRGDYYRRITDALKKESLSAAQHLRKLKGVRTQGVDTVDPETPEIYQGKLDMTPPELPARDFSKDDITKDDSGKTPIDEIPETTWVPPKKAAEKDYVLIPLPKYSDYK